MPRFTNFLLLLIAFILSASVCRAQWQQLKNPSGLPSTWGVAYSMDALDGDNAVISVNGTPGGIYLTSDGGKTWKPINNSSVGGFIDLSMPAKDNIWAATGNGEIYYTSDGGANWKLQYFDNTKSGCMMNFVKMFDLKNGVAMGDNTTSDLPAVFLNTSDGGNTWTSVNTLAFGGSSGDMWRRLDFPSLKTGYFLETGISPQYIYKTMDGGKSWAKLGTGGGLMTMKFYDDNLGIYLKIVSKDNLAIYRTKDGGQNFESVALPSSGWGNDIEFIPGDPAKVWFTDGGKLYFSTDTCSTYHEYKLGLDGLTMRDIAFPDNQHGWILGDNGVIFKTGQEPLYTTDVKENPVQATDFRLLQNYPNPFNPATRISFSIPEGRFVSLKVYDMLGNEVAALMSEFKAAGEHTAQFNASNLPSGMYIYQLRAGEHSSIRKMMFLK
ncbi:MAG TPA: T9SS type A sorting domain-containing protein [Ignavibacteriales bacterium]|nr:T9SS type A sorting domain-containing protein [Ignavibacteriales bacterium]